MDESLRERVDLVLLRRAGGLQWVGLARPWGSGRKESQEVPFARRRSRFLARRVRAESREDR